MENKMFDTLDARCNREVHLSEFFLECEILRTKVVVKTEHTFRIP